MVHPRDSPCANGCGLCKKNLQEGVNTPHYRFKYREEFDDLVRQCEECRCSGGSSGNCVHAYACAHYPAFVEQLRMRTQRDFSPTRSYPTSFASSYVGTMWEELYTPEHATEQHGVREIVASIADIMSRIAKSIVRAVRAVVGIPKRVCDALRRRLRGRRAKKYMSGAT